MEHDLSVSDRISATADNLKQAVAEMSTLPSNSGRGSAFCRLASKYPLPLGGGAIVLGLVAGLVLPSTTFEKRRLGEHSDRARATLRKRASELLARAKFATRQAADAALEGGMEEFRRSWG